MAHGENIWSKIGHPHERVAYKESKAKSGTGIAIKITEGETVRKKKQGDDREEQYLHCYLRKAFTYSGAAVQILNTATNGRSNLTRETPQEKCSNTLSPVRKQAR